VFAVNLPKEISQNVTLFLIELVCKDVRPADKHFIVSRNAASQVSKIVFKTEGRHGTAQNRFEHVAPSNAVLLHLLRNSQIPI
jgi:hypothetical protein